jgi:aerobic carbon-monoxide dehydrogenase large subunit
LGAILFAQGRMNAPVEKPAKTAPAIGAAIPRRTALRHLEGRARFVDDLRFPRMAHAAFLRSPIAHADIARIDCTAARSANGVLAVWTGDEIGQHCSPWVGTLAHLEGMVSAPQWPLARGRVRWQGEPVVIVVAESRALAEDAIQLIEFEWRELEAMLDPARAIEPGAPLMHPELGTNLALSIERATPDVDAVFARAKEIVDVTLRTDRVTPVTLEPRGIVADWRPLESLLTLHMSSQVPHMVQKTFAKHLGLPEQQVRVVVPDVGGSFGLKIHVYGDEVATAIAARLLRRPVKFVADRLEAFVSDIHARGHETRVRVAFDGAGRVLGVDVDDLCGIGAYSVYPRGSANEARQVVNLTGMPYAPAAYRARSRIVFQNKAMYGQFRAVGHPLACLYAEVAMDEAARRFRLDPAEMRERNYIPEDAFPFTGASGVVFESLSQRACLAKLLEVMNYPALRAEQTRLRAQGKLVGIGLGSFVENSNHSAATYGRGNVPIATQDGCTVTLQANGMVNAALAVTDTGQGTLAIMGQIVADAVGVTADSVHVLLGDTQAIPYGGANWGSRGTGISGEAAWRAGRALQGQLLDAAAVLLKCERTSLELVSGSIRDVATGAERMPLAELAHIALFRPDRFPVEFHPALSAAGHYAQKRYDGIFTNGVGGSFLEIDPDTGFVRVLGHWVVDDCGTVINPLLVDEQLRGGVVKGIGQVLFETCRYDENGQLASGSLMEYLVPMAMEMPDIQIGHIDSPHATKTSELGAKGAGEAGITAAIAATVNAINDALAPRGARITELPATPERILYALGIGSPRV